MVLEALTAPLGATAEHTAESEGHHDLAELLRGQADTTNDRNPKTPLPRDSIPSCPLESSSVPRFQVTSSDVLELGVASLGSLLSLFACLKTPSSYI